MGPAGSLDAGVALGSVLPPLQVKRVGQAVALRAQGGVHPPVGMHFGGVYDPGQEALYEGTVEGPSPAPFSRLDGQPRQPAPHGRPHRAPLPAQLRIFGPPWAPWAPSDQSGFRAICVHNSFMNHELVL